jgi:hypothetical protein
MHWLGQNYMQKGINTDKHPALDANAYTISELYVSAYKIPIQAMIICKEIPQAENQKLNKDRLACKL